jgi:hypothetical protein
VLPVLRSPNLMRLPHCESHWAGPFRYVPCLPKSKDASGGGPAVGVVAAAVPVQKIEIAVAGKGEDGEKAAAAPAPATAAVPTKSSLKKANCGDSKCAAKGKVQWLDLLGKDLTEVKEFEPR